MSTLESHHQATRSICIVGAGAAGLAALKTILDSPQFAAGLWKPTVFEARDDVGGIWLPSPPSTTEIPLTPLYDSLTTNLPHPLMAFSSHSFPPSTPLFPHAAVVQEYLVSYADKNSLSNYIRFNTAVVLAAYNNSRSKWNLQVNDGLSYDFDHLIVCNGHYRIPRLPDTPGLLEWLSCGRASHSAWYRNPDTWRDKSTILVVGAGPSGQDITSDLSKAVPSVIHSVSNAAPSQTDNVKTRGRIRRFSSLSDGLVEFEDGTVERGIDHCILATGYKFDFPFLPDAVLEQTSPTDIDMSNPRIPPHLLDSTYHVYPLAMHLFALHPQIPPSSLAFMGLMIRVVPFPLFEAQAAAICHAIVNPDAIQRDFEFQAVQTRIDALRRLYAGDPMEMCKAYHRCSEQEQWDYRDLLYRFISDSEPPRVVNAWEKEAYNQKDLLRRVWVKLVKEGKADDFVKGVGEGGNEEWIALMKRMLQMDGDEVI